MIKLLISRVPMWLSRLNIQCLSLQWLGVVPAVARFPPLAWELLHSAVQPKKKKKKCSFHIIVLKLKTTLKEKIAASSIVQSQSYLLSIVFPVYMYFYIATSITTSYSAFCTQYCI